MKSKFPDWVPGYIGIPFVDRGRDRDGCDCWGLARLVAREQFGVDLPSYNDGYVTVADAAEIARIIHREKQPWTEIPQGQEQSGDFVLLLIARQPIHVGVVTARPWMLHIEKGCDAVHARYDDIRWRGSKPRFYRWAGSAEAS